MSYVENLNLVLAFSISFLVSVGANWFGIRFADHMGLFAFPSARRRHGRPIAVSGGLWIFLALILGAGSLCMTERQWFMENGPSLWRVALCLATLMVLGWFDDRKILKVSTKFMVQISITALAMTIPEVREFTSAFRPLCGLLVYPLVLIFIVGVTNAVNFIDGADGLLASIVTVSFVGNILRAISLNHTQSFGYVLLPCLLGAILGFLVYNWRPARIFMGDTGSLTVGFALVLSCLSLGPAAGKAHWEGSFSEALSGVIQLGYPILDLLWVITKRLRRGFSPLRADQNHLHHVLMRLGFSVPLCVIALCSLNICFQVASFQVLKTDLPEAWPDVLFAAALSLTYLGWIITVERWKTRELSRMARPESTARIPMTRESLHDFVMIVQTKPLFEGHHFGNHEAAMAAIQSLGFLLESNCPKGCQVLWQDHSKSLHLTFPTLSVSKDDVQGLQIRIQALIDNWIEMFNIALSAASLRVSVGTTVNLLEQDTRNRLRIIKRSRFTRGGEDTAA